MKRLTEDSTIPTIEMIALIMINEQDTNQKQKNYLTEELYRLIEQED